METRLKLVGVINFTPTNKTKKHHGQAPWKKIAMVMLDGDICEYYSWLIKKRYNIILNKPLRRAHISFINDSIRDLSKDGLLSESEVEVLWENTLKKWDGKEVEIILDVNPKTDGKHMWLNIPHDERGTLQSIRNELGLGKPYFGMHMTIGTPHPLYQDHLVYIHESIVNGFIE